MKISTSFLASLAVGSLIPLLIFADVQSKENAKAVEKRTTREQLKLHHQSDWNLNSEMGSPENTRIITWTEALNVPIGAIPSGPSHIPSEGVASIGEAVNDLLSDLVLDRTSVGLDQKEIRFDACSSTDEFYGSFCVVSACVQNAPWVLSLPIGQEPSDEYEFEIPTEMAERISSQTDVIFADFQLSREQSSHLAESIHFRLWYDYSTGKWQEITRRKHERNLFRGYLAKI